MSQNTLRIFICYRRDDSAYAATTIYEKLCDQLEGAEVFFDVQTIPPGMDFRIFLQDSVRRCDVLLAIIGPEWATVPFEEGPSQGQPRLHDPDDYVRIEIASALTRHIPVIPVLVGNAEMPRVQQLPDDLRALAPMQAVEVRAGRDFVRHVEELVSAVLEAQEQRTQDRSKDLQTSKVYMSYSRSDRPVADMFASVLRTVGFIPLQELSTLSTSEEWALQVPRLIEEADLFVLLWSSNAQRSKFINFEWKHALSLCREQFIRPVYFEEFLAPPPEELRHLHFGRILGLRGVENDFG